jgi:hypothetical protein
VDSQPIPILEEPEETPPVKNRAKKRRGSQLLFLPSSPDTTKELPPVNRLSGPSRAFYPPPRRHFLGVRVPIIDPDPIRYGYLRRDPQASGTSGEANLLVPLIEINYSYVRF